MNEFLSNNILSLIVLVLSFIAVMCEIVIFLKHDNITRTKIQDEFTEKQYRRFLDNSKKAIVNSTVSFGAEMCSSKDEADDLYSRTVSTGNRMLKDEEFKITIVGKI